MIDILLSRGVFLAELIGVMCAAVVVTSMTTAMYIRRTRGKWQRNWPEIARMHRNNLAETVTVAPLVVIFVNAAGAAAEYVWRFL